MRRHRSVNVPALALSQLKLYISPMSLLKLSYNSIQLALKKTPSKTWTMPRKARATDSRRIEEERQAKFCGTASIRLKAIRFKTSASQGISGKEARSVASLKRQFREELESCQASGRYRVKVLIRQDDLKTALIKSNTSRVDLMASSFPYPKLELPSTLTLECLQGHDCLAAAEDVLEGSQKRWDADIFLDGELAL